MDESDRSKLGRLLSGAEEARLFWALRGRIAATLVRQALRSSRLRVAIVVVLSVVFWGGLYVLFAEGFHLLKTAIAHSATRTQTVHAIYNVFFVALLAMLTVSSAIIFFSSLYRSEEVGFLLTTPTSTRRIILYKFQEAVLFSCWGFVLLGSPMLVAYGAVFDAPPHYFAMLLPFMLSFVFIPASVGALVCMVVVYWMPSIRVHALVLVGAALVLGGLAAGWSLWVTGQKDMLTPGWLDEMLTRLEFAQQRLLPSWWLSSGLLEAANSEPTVGRIVPWRDSVMFLGVLISNSLLCVVILVEVGGRVLRLSFSRLQGLTPPKHSVRPAWIDRLVWGLTRWLPLSMRMLIVKDLRIFRRDPVQWSQFLIFFGLLALYFVNIRRFQYGEPLRRWMNMIGFLNLGVVGLILSTFTTRFIFPMISLEGRRFWILGSLPISRDAVLWSKLLFAAGGSLVPCAGPDPAERLHARHRPVRPGSGPDSPGHLLGLVRGALVDRRRLGGSFAGPSAVVSFADRRRFRRDAQPGAQFDFHRELCAVDGGPLLLLVRSPRSRSRPIPRPRLVGPQHRPGNAWWRGRGSRLHVADGPGRHRRAAQDRLQSVPAAGVLRGKGDILLFR